MIKSGFYGNLLLKYILFQYTCYKSTLKRSIFRVLLKLKIYFFTYNVHPTLKYMFEESYYHNWIFLASYFVYNDCIIHVFGNALL